VAYGLTGTGVIPLLEFDKKERLFRVTVVLISVWASIYKPHFERVKLKIQRYELFGIGKKTLFGERLFTQSGGTRKGGLYS